MKVLICHNCGGFGVTIGPVLRPICAGPDDAEAAAEAPQAMREEQVVYACQACGGSGFVKVAAAG